MSCLLIVDHEDGAITPATLSAVTAASQIGGALHALVAGHACTAVAEEVAKIAGVSKVFRVDAPHFADQSPENLAALVVSLSRAQAYTHVLSPATSTGKSFMPRVAALLDVAQISEIVAVISADTFVRPIYAGNVLATVRSADAVKVVTVRATSFKRAAEVGDTAGGTAVIEMAPATPDLAQSRRVSRTLVASERPELSVARVVVAGGRGLGSKESFQALLEPLADQLGAALGASRAAVDAGFVSNDAQVGQTGKVVAPQLYIAAGISGAIQHLAGMKESQVIVAINKDPEAAIFQVADYALVGDLFELVPQLTAALRQPG